MPQFEMPLGESAEAFDGLDAFTQGYVEAIYWTECNSDNPELEDATMTDLAPEALAAIVADCAAFQADCAVSLQEAYAHETVAYDEHRAGVDYWLTRNGHGAGFWDRGLGAIGDRLSDACRRSSVGVYRGDDGLVYLS